MGLISAGRSRIYRLIKDFLALSSIALVFLKARLFNERRIRATAPSATLSWEESAGGRFS
jgi:hypothetical protein